MNLKSIGPQFLGHINTWTRPSCGGHLEFFFLHFMTNSVMPHILESWQPYHNTFCGWQTRYSQKCGFFFNKFRWSPSPSKLERPPVSMFDKFHLTFNFKSKVSRDVFKNNNECQLTSTSYSKMSPQFWLT